MKRLALVLATTTALSGSARADHLAPVTPAQLPLPTPTTAGGVMAGSAPAHQFQTGVSTGGSPLFAQPQVGDVVGAINKAGDTMGGPLGLQSVQFSQLAAITAIAMVFCSDCLKPGEATGAGSGIPVFRDATKWSTFAGAPASN